MQSEPIMLTPGTLRVSPAVLQASIRQLQHRSPEVEFAFASIYARLRRLFPNSQKDLTLFPTTGRGGLEALISSLVVSKRTMIVVNGRWSRFMAKLAEEAVRPGLKVCMMATYPEDRPLDVERLAKDIEGVRPEVVVFTSHETERGLLNPTDQIITLCHNMGIKVVVDAMSSVVIDPAQVFRADAVCFNACKGIRSLRDVAIVATVQGFADELTEVGSYLNFMAEWRHQRYSPTPRTPFPVGPVLALAKALEELEEEGIDHRRAAVIETMGIVQEWAERIDLKWITHASYLGNVTLPLYLPPGWTYAAFRKALLKRGYDIYYSVGGPGGNTIEVSTVGWLSPDEVRAFCETASQILGRD